ncbi:MAG: ABC transporter permease subunit [Paenibacillaceae bacterium]|uniref:ABC transporter permease subunit n=1 Tax=Paenibacillus mellifer TaxID=2937794 RepID=A0A9X2BR96_9BACL|nr:ABC transporter permease subunit [Paenibacillus mellifer]MBW4838878.1 ABC transporter permease subunit [Paenibacillaceae bacterium]MCK8487100.1 ABC transporter permease subunit [Paenibacillus mellifer]
MQYDRNKGRGSKLKHIARNPFLYVMAVPGLLFFLVFSYLPIYGITIAFKDYDFSKGITGSEWVGFKNFDYFFTSDDFWTVLRNTLVLNALFIFFTTVAAVLIALMFNEIRNKYFKRISQSLIFLPYFMSWIVVGMIVQSMFGGEEPMINTWLQNIGMEPVNWMFESRLWPAILTVIRVWQGAGYLSIIFLAAITGISEDLYEAARIDGASKLQIMFRITLPLLVPTIMIMTLLSVGKIFNGDFAMIYAIIGDNSLLYPTTDVIDTFVFRSMRQLHDFGMSSAVGLFQSVMGLIFVLVANGVTRKVSKESALF